MTEERGALIEAMARALCEAQGVRRIDGNEMARARDEVEAALTAISNAGFAVVPIEPSEAMVEAGHDIHDFDDSLSDHAKDYNRRNSSAIYRAMIEAGRVK